jgi:hypothetical protein
MTPQKQNFRGAFRSTALIISCHAGYVLVAASHHHTSLVSLARFASMTR